MTEQMPKAVADAINAVMLAVRNVSKRGENRFHGYAFAKVEDLLFQVQPAMAATGLIITQDELSIGDMAGGALLAIRYAFTLSHKSGVSWQVPVHQTGVSAVRTPKGHLDDKVVNKCHTAARKYFLLGLFQVPAGDLPDSDGDDAPGEKSAAAKGHAAPPKEAAGAPAAERNAEPARGGYGRQKNNVDAVGAGPTSAPAQDGNGAPVATPEEREAANCPLLVGDGQGREGLHVLHRKAHTIVEKAPGYTERSLKSAATKLDAAKEAWDAWHESYQDLTPAQEARIEASLAAYTAVRRKIDAIIAGADHESGELQPYEAPRAA
jgi:hypothetical protein